MSELESDLYGDLYGNEDGDLAGTVGQDLSKTDDSPPESTSAESKPNGSSKPVEKSPAALKPAPVPIAAPVGAPIQSYTTPLPKEKTPSFPPQGTQQIPTYQQPTNYESQEVSASLEDGTYANGERMVRPSEMKDEGKMFIGGLNWDTTDESLRTYFTQFGKVDACTIMRDAAGRSRCFAFLTFEDPASVNAVMVKEHFLDGKIIDPKRAIPRQEHQRATKLFIGGLAGSVTSESMREFFSQFGRVVDSTVMLDRETGRSKGFGFVSFEDTNVQPFLGFGNLEIDGKMIDVKLAQPRFQRDAYPEESNQNFAASNAYSNQQQPAAFGGTGPAATGSSTPFDPQALAALYTRMFQMTGAAGMNPAMMGGMGGMNPAMMGAGGYGGAGGMGGMQMGRGMAMGRGMGGGMGMGMGGGGGMGMGMGMSGSPGMGAMGRGGAGPGMMGNVAAVGGMNQNIPRGPRGAPSGPGGVGGAGVGPQRAATRGQHSYHPYAR